MSQLKIETLWKEVNFKPNPSQEKAIKHTKGILYLTAGPGSGKTRVLLWRTLNLIVFHNIKPDEILLTTFTRKASHQLKEGLQSLLSLASNHTKIQYDISSMYIGTIHSLCSNLIKDRRFLSEQTPKKPLKTIDSLEQFFFIKSNWDKIVHAGGLDEIDITAIFQKKTPSSANKNNNIKECKDLFNRFSEEKLDINSALEQTKDQEDKEDLHCLIKMYQEYRKILLEDKNFYRCDLSLIQDKALDIVKSSEKSEKVFKHIIVDEYQDTNTIQEKLYFSLAGNKNFCVVGDDDQALYRFRGSTVENFVEFPMRVKKHLETETTKIPLSINYRSKKQIVDYYTNFIQKEDWIKHDNPNDQYRVHDKEITAYSKDEQKSVVYVDDEDWIDKVALFCKKLIDQKIVKDANQIAFLFPSLKNSNATNTIKTLRENGINVHAPRVDKFLDNIIAKEIFGIYANIFELPNSNRKGKDFNEFKKWIEEIKEKGNDIIEQDSELKNFVNEKKKEIEIISKDFKELKKVVKKNNWHLEDHFDLESMREKLSQASGLSQNAKHRILKYNFPNTNNKKLENTKQTTISISKIINRVTSLDWNLLDLFYQVSKFSHFKNYYDLVQSEGNEAPIYNLSKITELIKKFISIDPSSSIISASYINRKKFIKKLFLSYIYRIYRLDELEDEDQENPFPKGKIQALTIHQSKGLEFPVVFMYPKRKEKSADKKEEFIRHLIQIDREPIDKVTRFDLMRIFYVGLSRAENLIILPTLNPVKSKKGKCIIDYINDTLIETGSEKLENFDIKNLKIPEKKESTTNKTYSYGEDYIAYKQCPRQYMIYNKYNFTRSRNQDMLFNSLITNTIRDLNEKLILDKENHNESTRFLEIENWIEKQYETNYQRLLAEGGHALSPELKINSLLEVKVYYRKFRDSLENVSEIDVKLELPEQESPNGNKFNIRGHADIIVREGETTKIYNIKTQDAGYISDNKESFSGQLNVYTHMWKNLRNDNLEQTAYLATKHPNDIAKAINSNNHSKLDSEIKKWQNLIPVQFSEEGVKNSIDEFGAIVDKIEAKHFDPPKVSDLSKHFKGTNQKFATKVCNNCDAKFSCDSYLQYSQLNRLSKKQTFETNYTHNNNNDYNLIINSPNEQQFNQKHNYNENQKKDIKQSLTQVSKNYNSTVNDQKNFLRENTTSSNTQKDLSMSLTDNEKQTSSLTNKKPYRYFKTMQKVKKSMKKIKTIFSIK